MRTRLLATCLCSGPSGQDRVKILAWDGTGLCLFHKRLEKGRFVWPPVQDGAIRLSAAQLGLLLEGLDWSRVRPKPVIAPLLAG